jgi:hypothetical protein
VFTVQTGLFAATVAAFIIESYQQLSPNPSAEIAAAEPDITAHISLDRVPHRGCAGVPPASVTVPACATPLCSSSSPGSSTFSSPSTISSRPQCSSSSCSFAPSIFHFRSRTSDPTARTTPLQPRRAQGSSLPPTAPVLLTLAGVSRRRGDRDAR